MRSNDTSRSKISGARKLKTAKKSNTSKKKAAAGNRITGIRASSKRKARAATCPDPPAPAFEVREFEFVFPFGERTYRLKQKPSFDAIDFFAKHGAAIEPIDEEMEDDAGRTAYASRLYDYITGSFEVCNALMRTALYGDHTGVDWWRDASPTGVITVAAEYLRIVAPQIARMAAEAHEKISGIPT